MIFCGYSKKSKKFLRFKTTRIDKLLIANRGEIACRVIKTAKKMGIKTVAVYSDADAGALFTTLADEAFHIGPSPSTESYLQGQKILDVARLAGAQAIHPGYGFLSENAKFSDLVHEKGLIFIGPPASAISAMGSKTVSKIIMIKAGVPVVPGYHGEDQSVENFCLEADKIGYPVLLKAAHGGGGKGMRIVQQKTDMAESIDSCKRESLKSFGNDDLLIEKYLTQPRHIEVQIFADKLGDCVYLFERDCSVQRRHQKIIEEAPAPGITPELRKHIGEAAVNAAKAVGYVGAGTVEFIVEDNKFYFMEMNTRLQVEHPITEMITKQDLVSWQIKVAEGQSLPMKQEDLKIHGHAFEARIYAENPRNNFLPGSGKIDLLLTPQLNENVRIDTGIVQGDEISVFYDPMISKLVVWDVDRHAALRRLVLALNQYHIAPINTNIQFLLSLAQNPYFVAGDVHTGFIQQHFDNLFKERTGNQFAVGVAVIAKFIQEQERSNLNRANNQDFVSPWDSLDGYRMQHSYTQNGVLLVNSVKYSTKLKIRASDKKNHFEVDVTGADKKERKIVFNDVVMTNGNSIVATVDGRRVKAVISSSDETSIILFDEEHYEVTEEVKDFKHTATSNSGSLKAPMPGRIIRIFAKEGDHVKQGQALFILEAMKMEHKICSPRDGVIKVIPFPVDSQVEQGTSVVILEELEVKEKAL